MTLIAIFLGMSLSAWVVLWLVDRAKERRPLIQGRPLAECNLANLEALQQYGSKPSVPSFQNVKLKDFPIGPDLVSGTACVGEGGKIVSHKTINEVAREMESEGYSWRNREPIL